ncbi:DUF1667 domain-containing protein [Lachnospiraceae bacterium 62-35]
MVKSLICIGCPLGCMMEVSIEKEEITVKGNTCPRGEQYAKKEISAPTRIVTSTVCVENGMIPRISVKTQQDIPKDKIFECMEEIRNISVKAPVSIGDIIIENCAGTGVSVIATKNVERK